ncbi:MAG: T9SS type A sorting domain-containing protein [Bacteroidetes bacterium]|nr:T9SS type A sorting domain-containing protein [Bacteroidota bacterium]
MNKKIIYLSFVLTFIVSIGNSFAQSLFEQSNNARPTFFNNSFSTKEDLSARRNWEFFRLRDPYTNSIPANISILEREFAKTLPNNKTMSLQKGNKLFSTTTWTYRGPYNQGGRSRAVAVDINDPNIILSGGTTGGMWRSTDKGLSWTKVTPANDTIQTVTCVVQDTRKGKTNIWYYGTGEYSSNLELPDNGAGFTTFLGAGIYKSTDNGLTWTRLASTSPKTSPTFINPFQILWNIAVDTSNVQQDIVFAAVYGGIYRSADGGNTWNVVLGSTNNNSIYTNVAVTSKGEVYGALSNGTTQGIWHSTDGLDWKDITPQAFPNIYARILIANAPSNSNLIYILANTPSSGKPGSKDGGGGDYHSLWKFNAVTKQWTDLTNNLPDWSGDVGGYSSQSCYDMLIKVSPSDSNLVIIGGTNLYRTTNGFATKLDTTNWVGGYSPANDISSYPNQHPDEHDLFFLPSNTKIVYSGHDGGISCTNDITATQVAWTSLNNGFSTTQFYSVALDHATQGSPLIVGGMQDNGNMMDTTSNANAGWRILPYGGDGCISAVADGGQYIYFSTQNGNIMEGRLSDSKGALIRPAGAKGFLFVTPYVLNPTETKMIFIAAGSHIWRNSDILSSIPIGTETATTANWVDMTSIDTSNTVSALAVSRQPANILYYGTNNGKLFKVINADQDNATSTTITGSNFPQGFICSIAIDPQDANNVLVGFSNYNIMSLFYTSNGGTTWSAVAGNLEQNADGTGSGPSIRSVKILNTNNSKTYFVGTNTGLYATSDLNGISTNWVQQGVDNIGLVDVESIDTRDLDGTVIVGTFGNGVYSATGFVTDVQNQNNIPIGYALNQNYPNPFNPSTVINYQLSMNGKVTLKVYDVLGREVKKLVDEYQSRGKYSVNFDASQLASGVYFYELVSGDFISTKKMVLLK